MRRRNREMLVLFVVVVCCLLFVVVYMNYCFEYEIISHLRSQPLHCSIVTPKKRSEQRTAMGVNSLSSSDAEPHNVGKQSACGYVLSESG